MNSLHMHHPNESLILIPHLMGFKPRNALVLLALDTERGDGMCGPLARIEVDDTRIPHSVAHDILDFVNDYSVTTLAIAWFGEDLDEMVASTSSLELHEAASTAQDFIDERYGRSDVGFVSCLLTDYQSWIDARCLENRPSFSDLNLSHLVHSFSDIENSYLATELVFSGSAPLDIEPSHVWPRVGVRQRQAAVSSFRTKKGRVRGARLWEATFAKIADCDEPVVPANAVKILGGKDRIGRLNAALQDIFVRDRVLLRAIHPNIDEFSTLTPERAETLLADAARYHPVEQRIDQVIDLLGACASYSDDSDGSAYAVISYLHWWKGEAHKALANVEEALASDPEYSLARLVKHAVSVHLPPPWFDVVGLARDRGNS